ncbi:hypothetical protein C8Q77DRAFT_646708 [Trametes polyzona]|nr:hypothetical protein C8Q77DRAFT_646708 [Trametes polyzona]
MLIWAAHREECTHHHHHVPSITIRPRPWRAQLRGKIHDASRTEIFARSTCRASANLARLPITSQLTEHSEAIEARLHTKCEISPPVRAAALGCGRPPPRKLFLYTTRSVLANTPAPPWSAFAADEGLHATAADYAASVGGCNTHNKRTSAWDTGEAPILLATARPRRPPSFRVPKPLSTGARCPSDCDLRLGAPTRVGTLGRSHAALSVPVRCGCFAGDPQVALPRSQETSRGQVRDLAREMVLGSRHPA